MVEAPRTLLIADDSEDDKFLLRHAFARTGLPCQLRFVQDGQQAIDYLQRNPPYCDIRVFPIPSALILDLKMPHLDGFQVLEWLQSRPPFGHLLVLVHSGSDLEEDKLRAMQLGAAAYFVKSPRRRAREAMFHAIFDLLKTHLAAAA